MKYKTAVRKLADQLGFDFHDSEGRRLHFMLVCRRNGRKTFAPATPSDTHRTLKNIRAQMRRTKCI